MSSQPGSSGESLEGVLLVWTQPGELRGRSGSCQQSSSAPGRMGRVAWPKSWPSAPESRHLQRVEQADPVLALPSWPRAFA